MQCPKCGSFDKVKAGFIGENHGIARFKRRGKVVSRSLKDLMPAVAIYFHQVNLKYS
jgi:hypothetical protein